MECRIYEARQAYRPRERAHRGRRAWWHVSLIGCAMLLALHAQPVLAADTAPVIEEQGSQFRDLLLAGGPIGYVIIFLSLAMVALIIEHLLSIRRSALMPRELAEGLHQLLSMEKFREAEALCREQPTFLTYVVAAGIQEATFGYSMVERSMEDASVEQAARLSRKIEYLSLIGALAPMLGLMGTVWGMIQAFGEFTAKANPMPADFAPAISEALVTTLLGLCVAVPALAAYAWFRNRIDECVAEATLLAEHLVVPLRRVLAEKRKIERSQRQGDGKSGIEK